MLVVDDDAATRAAILRAVESFGHTCASASDGEEAWQLLRAPNAEIDVIISDWQMPGMTGLELCRRARRVNDEAPYVYFMLMTGLTEGGRLMEGMAAGADDFQRKPIDLDELEARLVSAARVVALHRRLARKTQRLRRDSTKLQAVSRTDALTNLANRRQMDEDLEVLRARSERYGRSCSIALCDIDHFKRLNDTLGHVAGDDALRRVAETLRKHLRASDAVYRYGGEEFLVLFPEQSAAAATLATERLRAAVEALGVTISAGVAELQTSVDRTANEWIARADAALYDAKRNGRNRISVGPSPSSAPTPPLESVT